LRIEESKGRIVHSQSTLGLISHLGFAVLGLCLVLFGLTRPSARHPLAMRWREGRIEPAAVPMNLGLRVFTVLLGLFLAVISLLLAFGIVR